MTASYNCLFSSFSNSDCVVNFSTFSLLAFTTLVFFFGAQFLNFLAHLRTDTLPARSSSPPPSSLLNFPGLRGSTLFSLPAVTNQTRSDTTTGQRWYRQLLTLMFGFGLFILHSVDASQNSCQRKKKVKPLWMSYRPLWSIHEYFIGIFQLFSSSLPFPSTLEFVGEVFLVLMLFVDIFYVPPSILFTFIA